MASPIAKGRGCLATEIDRAHACADLTHYPELDGLRGMAIASIVVYHYFTTLLINAPAQTVIAYLQTGTRALWAGVDLFFVLSGFLVACVLQRDFQRANPLRAFYLRRMCRIFPLYWTALLFAALLGTSVYLSSQTNLFAANYSATIYILMVQNFALASSGNFGGLWLAPTWSLAIEEQFYLLLPLLMLVCRRKILVGVCICLVLAAPVARAFYEFPASYSLPYCRSDGLFMGVLAALAWTDSRCKAFLLRRRRAVVAVAAACGIGAAYVSVQFYGAGGVLNHSVYSLFFAMILLAGIAGSVPSLSRFLRLGLLRWLGERSYPLYLFHYGILGLAFALASMPVQLDTWKSWAVMLSALVATLVAASLLHIAIERPAVGLGRGWSTRWGGGRRKELRDSGRPHNAESARFASFGDDGPISLDRKGAGRSVRRD